MTATALQIQIAKEYGVDAEDVVRYEQDRRISDALYLELGERAWMAYEYGDDIDFEAAFGL